MQRRGDLGSSNPQGDPMESHSVEDVDNFGDKAEPNGKAESEPFHSLVVIQFGKKVPDEAVDWLASKIQTSRLQGGGELLLRKVKEDSTDMVFHVSSTWERLLLGAELMEMKKPYRDGSLREVSMTDIRLFQGGADSLDQFLTTAEKQRIVLHELESIRATETDTHIPALPKVKLYHGQTIISKCLQDDVITQVFPLHEKDKLKALGRDWYQKIVGVQPLEVIHEYFGETIAMYFAFLGFYTMALIPPALIGIMSVFYIAQPLNEDLDLIIFFCVFNLVWATFFLESWKRYCSSLAYKWGTLKGEPFEEARAAYHGILGLNDVTGRLEPKYPKWKRALKFYGVSLPVVLFCLFIAFLVMLWYFWLEDIALAYDQQHKTTLSNYMRFLPTIAYAVVISIMNAIYRKLATALNDWENHRLQTAYDNHLITKLVLFDFANCFMSLFYVAFYMKDIILLRTHLAALLITQQILGQVIESVLPYMMYKRRKLSIKKKHRADSSSSMQEKSGIDDTERLAGQIESARDVYMGTLDDYLELYLQFGYVSLFSAVFPSAAFWALLNNITEIRSDGFKMCRVFQRPFARPTAGIGAWQVAFEVMSIMAVMTNCALIAMCPGMKHYIPDAYTEAQILLVFVFAEHGILFVKMVIAYVIPDEPHWVQTAIARVEYESKQAWRKQRLLDAQKQLRDPTAFSAPELRQADNLQDVDEKLKDL